MFPRNIIHSDMEVLSHKESDIWAGEMALIMRKCLFFTNYPVSSLQELVPGQSRMFLCCKKKGIKGVHFYVNDFL